MPVQSLLDHCRVDDVAAALDHVLGPADQPEIALGILPPEIAGVEPAILQEKRMRLVHWTVTIAGRDVGTFDRDYPDFTRDAGRARTGPAHRA